MYTIRFYTILCKYTFEKENDKKACYSPLSEAYITFSLLWSFSTVIFTLTGLGIRLVND